MRPIVPDTLRLSPFELRLIEARDVEATVRMWRRSREGVQPGLEARLDYSPEDDLAFFRNTLMAECRIWIADREGVPIGLLALEGESIEQLYIEPDQQRTGIGRALLDFAMENSKGRLQLHTHQSNMGARRFYEGHGFRAVEFGVSAPPESEPDVRYEWEREPRA